MYFLSEKFKTSPVILEKPRHVFVFQAERANDSNFGPKQGSGDSEKMLSKLRNEKGKQTLVASFERF